MYNFTKMKTTIMDLINVETLNTLILQNKKSRMEENNIKEIMKQTNMKCDNNYIVKNYNKNHKKLHNETLSIGLIIHIDVFRNLQLMNYI